jgi:hypothetical protein
MENDHNKVLLQITVGDVIAKATERNEGNYTTADTFWERVMAIIAGPTALELRDALIEDAVIEGVAVCESKAKTSLHIVQ